MHFAVSLYSTDAIAGVGGGGWGGGGVPWARILGIWATLSLGIFMLR